MLSSSTEMSFADGSDLGGDLLVLIGDGRRCVGGGSAGGLGDVGGDSSCQVMSVRSRLRSGIGIPAAGGAGGAGG